MSHVPSLHFRYDIGPTVAASYLIKSLLSVDNQSFQEREIFLSHRSVLFELLVTVENDYLTLAVLRDVVTGFGRVCRIYSGSDTAGEEGPIVRNQPLRL